MRPTRLSISLDAIVANAKRSQAACGAEQLCAVIKADAYGHGAIAVGRALRAAGVAFLAVALVEEARALRQAGLLGPILVLGADYRGSEATIVSNHLSVTVGQSSELQALAAAARAADKRVDIHLELDCGMARLGARTPELVALAQEALALGHVQVTGVMAHFTHADVPDAPQSRAQIEAVRQAAGAIAPHAPHLHYVHIISSGALATTRGAPASLARCGLSLYGLEPVPSAPLGLVPALSWLTRPVALRNLKQGEPVSYGGRWRAPKASRIATLPVGYADGYPRIVSQRGAEVLVRGQRAKVVGTICMDLCMVDVTDVPGVTVDDEVVLIGSQGEGHISAHELAAWADTIAYEILAGIMPRVPRTYFGAHAA